MADPSSPTGIGSSEICVVAHDEQTEVDIDADRWARLAAAALAAEGCRAGELTLTFVDTDEIAQLNQDIMGSAGPTDVLSFPLDDDPDAVIAGPVLLGDVVVCPAVAAAQASTHAGSLDDELALLTVHGVLHVLGHDHAVESEAVIMRERERTVLEAHHWQGPAPAGFRHEHADVGGAS